MENGVDFESVYLCGVKISIFQENFKPDDPLKIKILNNSDKSESLLDYDRVAAPNVSAIEQFSPEIRQMLDNAIMVNRDSLGVSDQSVRCFYLNCSVINFVYRKIKFLKNVRNYSPPFKHFQLQFGKKHAQPDANRPSKIFSC